MKHLRDLLRHDEDCPGGEGCECEDDEDCDDDAECDEEEYECREDGADSLRAHMAARYGANLLRVSAGDVARRAATILGVDVAGMTEAAMVALVTVRADEEWRSDEEREYERDEGGKFASTGAGVESGGGRERAGVDSIRSSKHNSHADLMTALQTPAGQLPLDVAARKVGADAIRSKPESTRSAPTRSAPAASKGPDDIRSKREEGRDSARQRKFEDDNFLKIMENSSGPRGRAAGELTIKASEVSERAFKSGTADAHREAMELHSRALDEHRAMGHSGLMREHAEAAHRHEAEMRKAERPETRKGSLGIDDDKREQLKSAPRSGEGAHKAAQSGQAQHDHGRAHHERAKGHADRAKAAASGTSKAARVSARKAAEHAALAKVAADHGDHAKAKEHHDKAERHANDAERKAGEHRGAKRDAPRLTDQEIAAGKGLTGRERRGDKLAELAQMRAEAGVDHGRPVGGKSMNTSSRDLARGPQDLRSRSAPTRDAPVPSRGADIRSRSEKAMVNYGKSLGIPRYKLPTKGD